MLVQFLDLPNRIIKILHVLVMHLMNRNITVHDVGLANLFLSLIIEASDSILKLLKDHHSLIVLRHTPANIDLLVSRPVFDILTVVTTDTTCCKRSLIQDISGTFDLFFLILSFHLIDCFT